MSNPSGQPPTPATKVSWRMGGAAWIVTAVFILSNSATPLYVRWQDEIGFSSSTLTVIFAAYILGLLLTLLVAGQVSDRFGRKVVLLPGLAAAIIACVLFACAHSVIMLVAARFLSGISVGVAVSAGMASIVDLGGPQHRNQASLLASISMVLGAGLGPLLAGSLSLTTPKPVVPIYAVELAILVSATLIALILPLKRGAATTDPWRLRLPSVPRVNRLQLVYGISIFAPGITATSFVLSLGPSLLSKLLDVTSPLIAGGMACAMFLTATGVQFMARGSAVRTIFLAGAAATALSMASIVIAISTSNAVVMISAALLAGSGQGLGQLGGLTSIGLHVPDNRRAEANAVFNIGGYIPAGLTAVATGFAIDTTGLLIGATGFAAILAVSALAGGFAISKAYNMADVP